MRTTHRIDLALSIATALLFSSCVQLEHPLTNAETSKADTALVGEWLIVNGHDDPPSTCFIGRKKEAINVLEFVQPHIDGETSEVVTERFDLFTTTVGSLHLVTAIGEIANDSGIWLFLYEHPDANNIKLYHAKEKIFAQAILDGKLQGRAYNSWFFGPTVEKVTDSPDNLRKFLANADKSCFEMAATPVTLKRVYRGH